MRRQSGKNMNFYPSFFSPHQFFSYLFPLVLRFQYAVPFTDKEGPLKLSPKQKRDFVDWVRPSEFCSEPKMVVGDIVDCMSIKQTVSTYIFI